MNIYVEDIMKEEFKLSDGQVFPIPWSMQKDEKLKEAFITSVVTMQNRLALTPKK